MATTTFTDIPVHTIGELPAVDSLLPAFTLTGGDLGDVTSESFAGRRLVLNIFPSIDTDVCAMSVRRFNQLASQWPNTTVLCVSNDLPFAQGRFCAAEGLDNVVPASAFRSDFGKDFGVTMVDGPLRGLLARSVVIADVDGTVRYTRLSPEITQEPDYDEAAAAAGA